MPRTVGSAMRLILLLAAATGAAPSGAAPSSLFIGPGGERSVLKARDAEADNPPVDRFVARFAHSAVVVGDHAYIDGGNVCSLGDAACNIYATPTKVNSTLSFSIAESWDDSKDVQINIIAKPEDVPGLQKERLFSQPGTDSFYQVGGWQADAVTTGVPVNSKQWVFEADGRGGGAWRSEQLVTDSSTPLRRTNENTVAGGRTRAYDLGGAYSTMTDPDAGSRTWQPNPYLRVYDYADRTWSASLTPWGDASLMNSAGGVADGLGSEGLFVAAGGQMVDEPYAQKTGRRETPLGFEQVRLYDPSTGTWYTQTATGSIPSRRYQACTVGVTSPNGTYELFMYGGLLQDPATAGDLNQVADVHILTIPGFRWFKVATTDTSDPALARSHHACVMAGGRSMISIGGLTTTGDATDVDPLPHGINVFDMTALTWRSAYDADAPAYQWPDVVRDWYAVGGRDIVDWSSRELRDLLVPARQDKSFPPSTGTDPDSDTAAPTASSDAQNPPAPTELNIDAVAGIVVGAVAAVGLLIFLAAVAYRRRHRTTEPRSIGAAELPGNHHGVAKPCNPDYSPSTPSRSPTMAVPAAAAAAAVGRVPAVVSPPTVGPIEADHSFYHSFYRPFDPCHPHIGSPVVREVHPPNVPADSRSLTPVPVLPERKWSVSPASQSGAGSSGMVSRNGGPSTPTPRHSPAIGALRTWAGLVERPVPDLPAEQDDSGWERGRKRRRSTQT